MTEKQKNRLWIEYQKRRKKYKKQKIWEAKKNDMIYESYASKNYRKKK